MAAGALMSPVQATCLGCGCVCDDIEVTVRDGRIDEARHACPLGAAWFGDGLVPAGAQIDAADRPLAEALDAAATLLSRAERPLVYLAADISCEAQRMGIACADVLHAALESLTSATALTTILAAQERGQTTATLGEIRNRADVMIFWGVDPSGRYPRYWSRYAPQPAGMFVPDGRHSRTVIAVDIGSRRGPDDADERVALLPEHELSTLTWLTAVLSGSARRDALHASPVPSLAQRLVAARYAVVVADADAEYTETGDTLRAHALAALVQALNVRTRAALSLLRAGGNRSGADSVLTSQTGYPAAIDFRAGYPAYLPHRHLADVDADAVLILGAADRLAASHAVALAGVPAVVIGPRATANTLRAAVAIDTGVAAIHSAGTAVRMDDVPIPLHAIIDGPPDATAICGLLLDRLAGAQ